MSKGNLQKLMLFGVSSALFVVCLVASQLVLPENCYLYEWRQVGLLCDGFNLNNPQPCPVCINETVARLARILFVTGFCFLILPFVVLVIKERRNHSIEQTKFFD
jgi:hypothetical protein